MQTKSQQVHNQWTCLKRNVIKDRLMQEKLQRSENEAYTKKGRTWENG